MIEENDNEIISITSTAAVDVVDKVALLQTPCPKRLIMSNIGRMFILGRFQNLWVVVLKQNWISSSESESSSKPVTHETRSKMTAESTDVEAATMGRSAFEVGSQTASPLATAGIVSTPTATEMSTTDAAAMDTNYIQC